MKRLCTWITAHESLKNKDMELEIDLIIEKGAA